MLDQGNNRALGQADASLVLTAGQVGATDVIPRGHHIASVHGDRYRRGMRKNEPYRGATAQVKFGHQPGKVISVGAQAMQPDYSGAGMGASFNLDMR